MIKIGITGGIGSGKSTVSEVWASLGAHIINADEVAKRLMEEDKSVRREIIQTFGDASYHPDGRLNRGYLAKEAFEKDRVQELNAIVHPRIPEEVNRLMNEAEEASAPAVAYEAALLFENLRPGVLDYLVLVLADEQVRITRVKERDKTSAGAVADRIDKQKDFEQYTDQADEVIENDGSLSDLKEKAEAAYHRLVTAKKE